MRLPHWVALFSIVIGGVMLFVLWTEHAYQRGIAFATYQCEYGDAGQVN